MIDLSPLDRHERIALCMSGGKDSLAVVYLLRPHLGRITVYHMDTGDLLPEMCASAASVREIAPHYVHIQGDVDAWMRDNGMPTDLLPYQAHEVGRVAGQESVRLAPRYDCCFANLMLPIWQRIRDDGNTLCIRGTKTADIPRVPAPSGSLHDGIEMWNPIEGWSHDEVFAYLRSVGATIPAVYDRMTSSPECARCPAWWGEGRAAYLRERHPALFADYAARLRTVTGALMASVNNLNVELGVCNGV